MRYGIKPNTSVSSIAIEKRRASEELLSTFSVFSTMDRKQMLKINMLTEWAGADFELDYWEFFPWMLLLQKKENDQVV